MQFTPGLVAKVRMRVALVARLSGQKQTSR